MIRDSRAGRKGGGEERDGRGAENPRDERDSGLRGSAGSKLMSQDMEGYTQQVVREDATDPLLVNDQQRCRGTKESDSGRRTGEMSNAQPAALAATSYLPTLDHHYKRSKQFLLPE